MDWANWWCKARSIPDEFYVHKATLAAGKFGVIRRSLGSKLQRMSFASAAERARTGALVTTADTPPADRNRFSLTDADVLELARYAVLIEQHYGRPMDIEWARMAATTVCTSCRPGPKP